MFCKLLRKRLRRMANPLQLSKTLAVLIASCNRTFVSWSPLIPCKYSECFKGARTALKCCTHTKLFPQILQGNAWGASPIYCNSQRFRLRPFWLLLATAHIVSWSPLIPCKYSESFKGARTALKCCTHTKLFPLILQGNAWGASPTYCNSQRLWPFWLLVATAHIVSWSPLIPCKYS